VLDRGRGRRHPREAAAPEPVTEGRALGGRAGNQWGERRLERGVRVLCPALHALVACLRCMSRWADRLSRSRIDVSERRAGRHTNGQHRCRSHGEEPLPHRPLPPIEQRYIRFYTASGAFRQASRPASRRFRAGNSIQPTRRHRPHHRIIESRRSRDRDTKSTGGRCGGADARPEPATSA
jgi:hypothetical protein